MYFSNSIYIRNKLYQKLLFISIFGGVRGINVSNIPSKCVQVEQVTLAPPICTIDFQNMTSYMYYFYQ